MFYLFCGTFFFTGVLCLKKKWKEKRRLETACCWSATTAAACRRAENIIALNACENGGLLDFLHCKNVLQKEDSKVAHWRGSSLYSDCVSQEENDFRQYWFIISPTNRLYNFLLPVFKEDENEVKDVTVPGIIIIKKILSRLPCPVRTGEAFFLILTGKKVEVKYGILVWLVF